MFLMLFAFNVPNTSSERTRLNLNSDKAWIFKTSSLDHSHFFRLRFDLFSFFYNFHQLFISSAADKKLKKLPMLDSFRLSHFSPTKIVENGNVIQFQLERNCFLHYLIKPKAEMCN